jgi:hypothetical protein
MSEMKMKRYKSMSPLIEAFIFGTTPNGVCTSACFYDGVLYYTAGWDGDIAVARKLPDGSVACNSNHNMRTGASSLADRATRCGWRRTVIFPEAFWVPSVGAVEEVMEVSRTRFQRQYAQYKKSRNERSRGWRERTALQTIQSANRYAVAFGSPLRFIPEGLTNPEEWQAFAIMISEVK